MSGPGDLSKVNTTSGEMFKRKTREAYFSFQGCSVAVNPGAKKQREQLAGFPLSCVPQHILAKGQKM